MSLSDWNVTVLTMSNHASVISSVTGSIYNLMVRIIMALGKGWEGEFVKRQMWPYFGKNGRSARISIIV